MLLEQINRKQAAMLALRSKLTLPTHAPLVPAGQGRTIGIRITDDERERIVAIQRKHALRTYAETVRALVKLGLEAEAIVHGKAP